MPKKLATYRTIAWILGILLVIALIVIFINYRTISDLKSPARQNITAQRDIIREECSKTDPDSKERCSVALKEMIDLLADLSKQNATSQGLPIENATANFQVEKK